FQPAAELCLILQGEPFIWSTEIPPGPLIENERQLAMQPVGSPVRRNIRAMSPNRSDLHSSERLPHVLAARNLAGRNDVLSVCSNHSIWNRRHLLVDSSSNPAQDRK